MDDGAATTTRTDLTPSASRPANTNDNDDAHAEYTPLLAHTKGFVDQPDETPLLERIKHQLSNRLSGIARQPQDVRKTDQPAPAPLPLLATISAILTSSRLNVLLVFVPAGVLAAALDLPVAVVFAANAIAVIPLSNLLAWATELVAADAGDVVGALVNISLGNLIEVLMFRAALARGQVRVVQAALVGSVLVNLLPVLGTAIIAGDACQPASDEGREQIYDMNGAQALACLLSLSVFSVLIPLAVQYSFADEQKRDHSVLLLSRASSFVLLFVYFVYLVFLLRPRRRNYTTAAPPPRDDVEEGALPAHQPGRGQRCGRAGWRRATSAATRSRNGGAARPGDHQLQTPATPSRTIKFADEWRRPRSGRTTDVSYDWDLDGLAGSQHPVPEGQDDGDDYNEQGDEGDRDDNDDDDDHSASDKVRRWMSDTPPALPRREVGSAYARRRSRSRSRSRSSFGAARRPRHTDIVERYDGIIGGGGPSSSSRGDAGAHYVFEDHLPSMLRYDSISRQSSVRAAEEDAEALVMMSKMTASLDDLGGGSGDGDGSTGAVAPEAAISRAASVAVLVGSSLLTAVSAELLVGAIEQVTQTTPLTETFIGLIVLPLVGNAAEYLTAVAVAARGKLDLAIGVSFGSSIQIALLVNPLMVLLGWAMHQDMTLYFGLFETATMVGSALLVNFLMANGKTNYLEGTLLCACYVMVSIGSYLTP